MRAVLEGRAMARVAASFTPEQDARLTSIVESMRAPLDADDIDAVAELDWQLHGLIMELSEFTLLRRTWESLAGLVRLRSYQALGRSGPAADYFKSTAIESHVALLEALRTGDPAKAAKEGSAHVLEVSARLALERKQHNPSPQA
jgi:DNA-binding GntR family transcriptional regulator